MKTQLVLGVFCLLATAACDTAVSQSESKPAGAPPAAPTAAAPTTAVASAAKPLLLEKNEGDLRVRRIPDSNVGAQVPSSEFMVKVGPGENGSQHLVAITEDLPPGASIVKHRHLGQDEIILIQTGTAQVRVGDMERTLHAGGLIFLPSNTFIEARNIGSDPISLVAIFSAPGFDAHLKCASVPAGQKPTTISREELAQCAHEGHAEFAIPTGPPGK